MVFLLRPPLILHTGLHTTHMIPGFQTVVQDRINFHNPDSSPIPVIVPSIRFIVHICKLTPFIYAFSSIALA